MKALFHSLRTKGNSHGGKKGISEGYSDGCGRDTYGNWRACESGGHFSRWPYLYQGSAGALGGQGGAHVPKVTVEGRSIAIHQNCDMKNYLYLALGC